MIQNKRIRTEYMREYRRKNKDKIRKINKKWKDKSKYNWYKGRDLEKVSHEVVAHAIKKGWIIKQPCFLCGTIKNIRAHHKNYMKPFKIIWLCEIHHRELHRHLK